MLINSAKVLRSMLKNPGIIVAPGVYDGISARVIEQAGFSAAFMTGAGTAASAIGEPDIGLTTLTEMVNTCKTLTMTLNIPLICDADTGYGNALNVIRTVHEYEMAGAAAIELEDQLAPKRCGHMSGKVVIPAEEFAQKIKAAANERYDKDTLIVARTDSRGIEGFDSAVERCKRYIDAGADILFFEAPQSVDEVRKVAELFKDQIPLLSNQVFGGRTPSLTADELEEMGYKIVIFGSTMPYTASVLLRQVADKLMKNRTDKDIISGGNAMDLFKTMGVDGWMDLSEKYK
jgi:2-methylisocitrate lyase-like PEP mutase family enzyme